MTTKIDFNKMNVSEFNDLIIEKVNYKKQAFKNIQNDKVVRYYNDDLVAYDGYNTFQIL